MNTPEKLVKRGVRVGASLGLLISTIISPIDSPKEVKAESNLQEQNTLTLLHGDGSKDRLNILLLPYNRTTPQMLQEVAQDIFLISPTDEFKNKVNVYTTNPAEDLKCDQNASCDLVAINREINRVVDMGVIPHETMVVVKSNDRGGAGLAVLAPRTLLPDIKTSSAVVRPEIIPPEFKEFFAAGAIAHELWGHAFAGFDHDGHGDLMDHYNTTNRFSPQHSQFLRAHMALTPHNYLTPQNEIRTVAASLGFKSELVTPIGTTQQKRLIIPFNNDGPAITLLRNQEGFFEVPAPQIGIGNYILLPDMSYTWKEWSSSSTIPLSWTAPQWEQVEGWPGVFFPNPPAEIKVHTPKRDSSAITAISPKNGEIIDVGQTVLRWANRDLDVFYYEIRASKDCTFNTNPETATAPIWHNLIHGGESKPLNSWQTPPLELNTEYCWGARPRIQGDGTPVEWSQTFRFRTPAVDARTKTYSAGLVDQDYGRGIIGPSEKDYDIANPQP